MKNEPKINSRPSDIERRGRPPLYQCLLESLAPSWAYTPSLIAEFARAHGFLDYLIPYDLTVHHKKNRIRVALGRYPNLRNFPFHRDPLIVVRGRYYPAWYGWRWQNKKSAEEGEAALSLRYAPLLALLDSETRYTLKEICSFWESLDEPCPRAFWKLPEPEPIWRAVRAIQARLVIMRRALWLGFETHKAYTGAAWKETPREPTTSGPLLLSFLDLLDPHSVFTVAKIVELMQDQSYFPIPEEPWLGGMRRQLYALARQNLFPECGDTQVEVDGLLIPAWAGSRWARVRIG